MGAVDIGLTGLALQVKYIVMIALRPTMTSLSIGFPMV
jgi:hypothetical protein